MKSNVVSLASNEPELVPLIKADLPSLEDVAEEFRDILQSGRISNFGKYLLQFEENAGKYLGAHVATVTSGTMGLICSLQAKGLKPGQKVLVPSHSFMATAQAVLYAGGVPVFAECGQDMLMDLADMENVLAKDPDIAGVIPVHMYGAPCHVHKMRGLIESIVKRRGGRELFVIYDGAHAFGAAERGVRLGGFGDAEVFSLSVTKTLVSVEGGMIASKDAALITRIKKMRNYGIESNYDTHYAGLNGKMSEFHAVVGNKNLARIDWVLNERTRKSHFYKHAVETTTNFRLVSQANDIVHTYKDFSIVLPEKMAPRRTEMMEFLKLRGIETRAYFYPPIHEQAYFKKYATRALPVTEAMSRRVLTLPFFTTITNEQMERVAACLKEAEEKFA